MTHKLGMMWRVHQNFLYDAVVTGLDYYTKKYKCDPKWVHVQTQAYADKLVSLKDAGIEVIVDRTLLKNDVWIGDEE